MEKEAGNTRPAPEPGESQPDGETAIQPADPTVRGGRKVQHLIRDYLLFLPMSISC